MNEKFADWLNSELEQRGWNQSKLAQRAGLGRGTISNVINNVRKPGPEICKAIAKALSVPEEVVFREAGILEPEKKSARGIAELQEVYNLLPESDRQELLDIARMKLERQEASKRRKPETRPAEG